MSRAHKMVKFPTFGGHKVENGEISEVLSKNGEKVHAHKLTLLNKIIEKYSRKFMNSKFV